MVLSDYYWLTILLVLYFLVRLVCLNHKKILLFSLVIGSVIGLVTCWHHYSNQTQLLSDAKQFVVGVQTADIKYDGNQIQFYGTIQETNQQKKLSEKVVVFYYAETLEEKEWWQSQESIDKIVIEGVLTQPESNRNQYQFDYQEYLFNRKIHWILSADTLSLKKDPVQDNFWQQLSLSTMKHHLLQHIDETVTPKIGNYMKTLLLGDVGAFETDLLQDFKDLGLLHLLSISGLHIQFLFAGLSYLLLRFGVTKETSYFILVPILFAYGSLIGWGTSAFRAVVASFISLTALHFQMKISSLDGWSITLLLALLIDPYQISSVGFQLSYLLSLLLLLFSKTFLTPQQSYLKNNFMISFVMTIASIPVLMFHFFEFPWIGTIANLIFIPFFSWVLIPLMIYLVLSFLITGTALFDGLLMVFEKVLSFPEWIAKSLSKIPFNLIVTGRIPFFLMIVFCVVLTVWFIALETKKSVGKASVCALVVLIGAAQFQSYSPFTEVIVIDVGQGDAIFIKEPYGKGNYLIDTGGTVLFDREEWTEKKQPSTVASRALIPLLKAKGIRKLDRVFVTHGDADHIQALEELAEEIPIDEVVYSAGTEQKELFRHTAQVLKKEGVTLISVLADREKPLKVTPSLYVVWPFVPGMGENKDSLVLYGKIGAYNWLFTGDMGAEEEKELLNQFPNLKVDILKVGHHGSNTSTSEFFVQQLQPQVALISTKQNNQFGHPHAEVLDLLEQEKVKIYRTDKQGSIHYTYSPFLLLDPFGRFDTVLKDATNF
ncbi:DNA internalization-related competence protein ComEC/Rec2 [Desemzia sp. RIT804]|uniref:DNA internalization-related competence protein ComEC/Rec2 n=1 Tax=Desemzia sp. RIT 804 TaxID=2810209 RepID=UPI0019517B21|nr:DNA internalization-related competence protein ComEC/Rec2 [Desemzia sp. RIT 804]MBM6613623.1 DNA internalization-related competence protein ComEC/Rec2 [Desemzia sp. RIT 804]